MESRGLALNLSGDVDAADAQKYNDWWLMILIIRISLNLIMKMMILTMMMRWWSVIVLQQEKRRCCSWSWLHSHLCNCHRKGSFRLLNIHQRTFKYSPKNWHVPLGMGCASSIWISSSPWTKFCLNALLLEPGLPSFNRHKFVIAIVLKRNPSDVWEQIFWYLLCRKIFR